MPTVATRSVTLAMMMISTTKDGNGSVDMGPLYSNIFSRTSLRWL